MSSITLTELSEDQKTADLTGGFKRGEEHNLRKDKELGAMDGGADIDALAKMLCKRRYFRTAVELYQVSLPALDIIQGQALPTF